VTTRNIIVVRGTDNDGPYRTAGAADKVRLARLSAAPFTVAGQPVGVAGGLGYCSNGAAGDPTGCVHDGLVWKRLTLGDPVDLIKVLSCALAGYPDYFHVLEGPTSALLNTHNYIDPPGAAGGANGFYSLFTFDGEDVWLGGTNWNPDIALSNTFWRSIDGGANWTNESSKHPDGKDGLVFSIWGVDGEMWACGQTYFGFDRIMKYNTGTGNWDSEHVFVGAAWPNCVWGPSSSEMYCVSASFAVADKLWQQTGGGWAAEGAGAGSLQTVLNTGQTGWPVSLVGDGTKLYAWCGTDTTGYEIYSGTFNGTDWVKETRAWNSGRQFNNILGRNIGCDETGAIWLGMFETATNNVEVYRRDPITGVWALSHVFDRVTVNNGGALWVADSGLVVVGGGNLVGVWNGATWTDYTTSDFVGWSDTYMQPSPYAIRK